MSWKSEQRSENYSQLMVWEGTLIDESEYADFQEFIASEIGSKNPVKIIGTVKTLRGYGGPGGRSDMFFIVHNDDINRFAIGKMKIRLRWYEDVLDNTPDIYPKSFTTSYPPHTN